MGETMDTWLDSPYIYDIYDTNDGYYMTVMTQVIYEGWHTNIPDMSSLNREYVRALVGVGEGQETPARILEKREGEERGHMA